MSNDNLEALLERHYEVADALASKVESLTKHAGTPAVRDHATALALVVDKIASLEGLRRVQHCPSCGIRSES